MGALLFLPVLRWRWGRRDESGCVKRGARPVTLGGWLHSPRLFVTFRCKHACPLCSAASVLTSMGNNVLRGSLPDRMSGKLNPLFQTSRHSACHGAALFPLSGLKRGIQCLGGALEHCTWSSTRTGAVRL